MKKSLVIVSILAGVIGGTLVQTAMAALKVWSPGEVLLYSDLNNNFTTLNNSKIGLGVLAVNSDIASSAAISHSKMATPALLPKAWAVVTANCTGSTAAGTACTVGDSSQLTVSTNGVSGQFRGVLSYTPSNTNFAVFVTSHTSTTVCMSDTRATTSPHFLIKCFDYAGAPVDVNQFSVLVMDT